MQGMIKSGVALAACLASALAGAEILAGGYRLSAEAGEPLEIAAPAMPDLSVFTAAAAEARIQRKPEGRAVIKEMLHEDVLDEFIGGEERLKEWVVRQKRMPRAIFIEKGYMNTAALARQLPREVFAETAPGVYLARLPIIVRPGATLHIDRETRELRLSQEAGAFLVNDGRVFIIGTRVSAWRETIGEPALWRDGKEFRPYFLAWGGTETYVVDSVIQSFGYDASKAYGFSISQYSPSMAPKMKRSRPTGWLLNSRFIDMWYGFYCYEADDVVILGNTYEDNIVYGIDPHDRSRRLIIAENEAFGTKKKHGIIISREVNDSWIINNRSHHNKLSGIVLDRSSVNNVVAYNETYKNEADGITLYESPRNLLWHNRSMNNERHGIRVRNSLDVRLQGNLLAANKLTGIYGHIKDLRGTDRDLEEDPFDPRVSLRIVGDQLVGNGSSPIAIHSPTRLELYRLSILAPQKSSGISFSGLLGEHQAEIMDILLRQQRAVLIEPAGSLASKE
ncbi:mannuronan 5-epimerase AlgG [Pseudomonas sp. OTU5201]|uniref:mannuronan 5-epimerase AlgG n=1 Tax=Pseudomonas sp. OTU5201 TaxID=3043850 RepID=UPI00313B38BC